MAKYALSYDGSDCEKVDAAKLPLHTDREFFCTTPGCNAKMFLRSPQKASACFVSYSVDDHSGGYLCHVKDQFKPDQYDESLFSPDILFSRILSFTDEERESRKGSGGVGTHKKIGITTLRTAYLMCVQYRAGGSYNKYSINDILIDRYNYHPKMIVQGKRMIACTFQRYDSNEQTVYMNAPDNCINASQEKHKLLKIHVPNNEMYRKCRDKLYDDTHSKVSVVAADWKISRDPGCLCECELTSVGKQICRGD